MSRFTALLGLLAAVLLTGAAQAHDARPLSVDVAEQGRGLYLARLKFPPSVAEDNQPTLAWPSGCRVLSDRPAEAPSVRTTVAACRAGLEGATLGVRYPIYNPALSTLFRLRALDGRTLTQVQPPDRLDWRVPENRGWAQVAAGYLTLGLRHIWTGVDHLLFVAGLLVLAGSPRRALVAVTGFTVAHSITLSLSALGLVQLPIPPTEAAIALSILFLAREIARPGTEGLARRHPILVSSSFGLLHGFGFAAALREAGLPRGELALGLLSFNLGVEIGQILFIAAAVALFLAARAGLRRSRRRLPALQDRWTTLAGYGLGLPAAFWLFQRLLAFAG